MTIAVADVGDVDEVARGLVASFANDALIDYLFYSHPQGVAAGSSSFFSILMRAGTALKMPTLVCRHSGRIVGSAMGYDTDPPHWPEPFNVEWRALAEATPGFAARLKTYEGIASRCVPDEPHYYLGVLGVHPAHQGQG